MHMLGLINHEMRRITLDTKKQKYEYIYMGT